MTTSFAEKVYVALRAIPKGRVVTYGQIAEMIGNPNASRAVGNALHKNPDPENIPCFRVVNAQGKLSNNFAFGGLNAQRQRLEADGIIVINNTVDLNIYQ